MTIEEKEDFHKEDIQSYKRLQYETNINIYCGKTWLGTFFMPFCPRIGEYLTISRINYEIISVWHTLNGPKCGGYNWTDISVKQI